VKHRRTKTVATIGPASSDEATIERLAVAGMDVARINFSHGERHTHAETIRRLHSAAARTGRPLAIVQDLQGPKIRLGEIPTTRRLAAGDVVTFGRDAELPLTMPELTSHLRAGDRVLFDDGLVAARALSIGDDVATLAIENDGEVSSHKGVNLPDTPLPIPSLTAKDREDLAFGVANGVDYVALSFVRGPDDVRALKAALHDLGGHQRVVAKIEKKEALASIDEIIEEADALMVARGDLGVEIPLADVPLWQKDIVARAIDQGKPVITATQMLQSMVEHPRPTRAEVSDVANAILELADAVMLSGETAVGRYPVDALEMMVEIAEEVAAKTRHEYFAQRRWEASEATINGAISYGACDVARKLRAVAIVTATSTGATARAVAKNRPEQRIVAVSPDESVVRQLSLCWGVTPLLGRATSSFEETVALANDLVLRAGLGSAGDLVVVTAGVWAGRPGATNLIKAHVLTA